MLRSRAPETGQRSSSPRLPLRDRTNTCNKPENALRSTRTSPFYEKKRGSKMSELEKKLNKAVEEINMLKDQLALTEAAKQVTDQLSSSAPIQEQLEESQETAESTADEPAIDEIDNVSDHKEESSVLELKSEEVTNIAIEESEHSESSEVVELKAKLLEKEEEIEFLLQQNMIFKAKAEEQAGCIAAAAKEKEMELRAKLSLVEEELRASREREEKQREQIEVAEAAKAVAEVDVRRMKVQSEQWRKAAEAAAAVVAVGSGVGECRKSMDVSLVAGGVGKWRMSSTAAGELENGDEGKRKGAGIRIFGDLLKKKGQQQK